jgi:hypothetical protein
MSLRTFDMSYSNDPPLLPTLQQRPYLIPDRQTTRHVRKTRKIRFSQSRASPVRTVSTPITPSRGATLEGAHEHLTSIQHSFSIDPSSLSSATHILVGQPSCGGQTLSELHQSSVVSSWSNSGNTLWSRSNLQSSADYSTTDISGVATPDLTFSDSDSSFANLKYVTQHPKSSLDSETSGPSADELISRPYASNIPHAGRRPRLWVDTTLEGTPGDFCDSPIEGDHSDQFPCSGADDRDIGYQTSTPNFFKSQFHGTPHHCVAGLGGMCSGCLNELEASFASDAAPAHSFEDSLSSQASALWCPCHWLLKRPAFVSPEPRAILSVCALSFRHMRKSQQTVLRRLQDMFEAEWQRVRQAVPGLQEHIQHALSLILDINPTLQEGLETLKSLSSGQPPSSLRGYISLAFFAKASLSLEKQPGLAEVNTALFVETARDMARMTRSIDQPAYDILLQLLWIPLTATTSPLESQALFCPRSTTTSVGSSKDNSGTKTNPIVRPKWILNHVCREIVEGKSH